MAISACAIVRTAGVTIDTAQRRNATDAAICSSDRTMAAMAKPRGARHAAMQATMRTGTETTTGRQKPANEQAKATMPHVFGPFGFGPPAVDPSTGSGGMPSGSRGGTDAVTDGSADGSLGCMV